jgi:molybdate transport system ATP-binding protein
MLHVDIEHQLGEFSLDIHAQFEPGLTALFGPSGAGKTSLIHAVAGILNPRVGRIVLGERVLLDTEKGIRIPTHLRQLAYIFQDPRLFPHMTVLENLRYGQRFLGARQALGSLDETVEILGIGHLLSRHPAALSGGEKQRVAIGRALLSSPSLMLADEPLAALDEPRKEELMAVFERIRDDLKVPIIYVSHASAEVSRLADTIIRMDQGRVVERCLRTDTVAQHAQSLMGRLSIPGVVTQRHSTQVVEVDVEKCLLLIHDSRAQPGDHVMVTCDTHHLKLGP